MNTIWRYEEYDGSVSKRSLNHLREFQEVYMIEVVQEFFYLIWIFYLNIVWILNSE